MGELVANLTELVEEERKLAAEVADLEARHRALRELIQEEMVRAGAEKADVGPYTVSVVSPKAAEKLDRTRLIAAGVTPVQLAAATILVPRAQYVTVRERKADG